MIYVKRGVMVKGKTDGTATCLVLGCKHDDVTDNMWKSPWSGTPPVREADDYLMWKYRDGLDDDLDDDDDVPGLVLMH